MKEKTKKDIKSIIKTLKNLPHAPNSMKMSIQLPIEEWEAILRQDKELKLYKKAFTEMAKNYYDLKTEIAEVLEGEKI